MRSSIKCVMGSRSHLFALEKWMKNDLTRTKGTEYLKLF